MQVLRDHFSGEENSSRRIAEVENLQKSLHFKYERSTIFEIFLTKCQKIYSIFDDENEAIDEKVTVRFLFKAV